MTVKELIEELKHFPLDVDVEIPEDTNFDFIIYTEPSEIYMKCSNYGDYIKDQYVRYDKEKKKLLLNSNDGEFNPKKSDYKVVRIS